MFHRLTLPALLCFLSVTTTLFAQIHEYRRVIDPFTVADLQGNLYEFALLGGFNQPRPQFVDIDSDGDPDLFVQKDAGAVMFFENTGSATSPAFEWRTDHYQNLALGGWFKFVDIDADGDVDLFVDGAGGTIKIYQNTGAGFEVAADTLYDAAGARIATEVPNIPELADIDCDGDLDLFLSLQTGAVTFYENTGLNENSLPQFTFRTNSFQDILVVGVGKRSGAQPANRHGASTLTFADIDSDGDLDLFWGDIFARSLYHFENTGSCGDNALILLGNRYPVPDTLLSGGFNVPHFADLDGDGLLDLFAGVLGGAFASPFDGVHNFYYYQNRGTATTPDFVLRERRFLETLDIGENSIPALADIDDDGDADLFIANEADTADADNGRIYFFENRQAGAQPSFRLIDSDFLKVEAGFNPAPAFVDIDADGDLDLFVGEFNGTLKFFRNAGSAQNPNFQLESSTYADIDVGNNSRPVFADIDDDGDADLFIGEFLGNLNFFENIGSASEANFVLDTTDYFGIRANTYSSPAFADADDDGDLDLFLGSEDGPLQFYRNDGSRSQARFVAGPDFPLPVVPRSAPVFVDLDSDGDSDLLLGNKGGGLLYFENLRIVTNIADQEMQMVGPVDFALLQNYPNPFNPSTMIKYQLAKSRDIQLAVYNLTGQLVRILVQGQVAAGHHTARWDGRDRQGQPVASGVYLYGLRAGDSIQSRKMVLVR